MALQKSTRRRDPSLQQPESEQSPSTRLLAEAISHLGEGVVITDDGLDWPGPRIVFANQAMYRITGYTPEELVGKTPRILQGERTDRAALDHLKRELSDGRSCSVELVNYGKDGTPYDAEVFVTPLFDAEGRRTNFVAIHRDVTKRNRAQLDLKVREERLQAVLNTAADAIITIDQRGIIISVNPATERMFGYSQDKLVGQNIKILMPPPYCDEHDGYIAQYLQTGEPHIIGIGREVVGRRQDGTTFPAELAVNQVDHLALFTGIIRDVTERRKAEEALRCEHQLSESIIDTARNIILILDMHGRIVRFNAYLEKLTGWRLDEVRGQDWFETFLPEHCRQRVRDVYQTAIGGERTLGNINPILTKDGREREIEWYDAPLDDDNGRLVGLLCTGLDVTERRTLERELLEIAAEEQRRIGQELHDSTQQQLTGLGLLARNVTAALDRLVTDEAEARLGQEGGLKSRIEDLHRRMQQIQDGLEQTAREVNQLSRGLIPVEIDGQGLMASLEELTRSVSDVHQVQCTFASDRPIEMTNNSAATHLFRIAQEAVGNALKHSRADRIEVSLTERDNLITLRILDNGRGIDNRSETGPGMGLRIMKYRAELIGASLSIRQADGGGTEVICTLSQS